MLSFTRWTLALVLSFVLVELPVMKSQAHAAMITTTQAVDDLTTERDTINNFMARADVKEQLIKLGVDEKQVDARLASLSDKEVKKLAYEIDQATAGGDAVIGVLSLILLIILIFVLVDVLD